MDHSQDDPIDVLDELGKHVANLCLLMRWYRQMFCDHSSRDIVLEIAPAFFVYMHDILVDRILLDIAKIATDESKDTVTVLRIVALYEGEKIQEKIKRMVDKLKKLCKDIKANRNKRIAHHVVKSNQVAPLNPVSVSTLNSVVDTLTKLMNLIHQRFDDQFVDYKNTVCDGDAGHVVYGLWRSIKLHHLEKMAYTHAADDIVAILRGDKGLPEVDRMLPK